jgi:hypothetical protein
MLALHNFVHFECVNYIESRQSLVELVVCFTSFALVIVLRAQIDFNKKLVY